MKKLLTINYSANAFNFAVLIFRLSIGILMMHHGYYKLIHFGTLHNTFGDVTGMGSTASLCFYIFAEFFCALFLILGLFTRFSLLPLIICATISLITLNHKDIFGSAEKDMLYLASYLIIIFIGPGKVSVDGMIGK
jgi:putative oxidoreductase